MRFATFPQVVAICSCFLSLAVGLESGNGFMPDYLVLGMCGFLVV